MEKSKLKNAHVSFWCTFRCKCINVQMYKTVEGQNHHQDGASAPRGPWCVCQTLTWAGRPSGLLRCCLVERLEMDVLRVWQDLQKRGLSVEGRNTPVADESHTNPDGGGAEHGARGQQVRAPGDGIQSASRRRWRLLIQPQNLLDAEACAPGCVWCNALWQVRVTIPTVFNYFRLVHTLRQHSPFLPRHGAFEDSPPLPLCTGIHQCKYTRSPPEILLLSKRSIPSSARSRQPITCKQGAHNFTESPVFNTHFIGLSKWDFV